MLVKYATTSACTVAQVINDLMRLACGESIANLSASCDKVNSAVVANTVAPGWTLVDSAGPNSGTVISAPDAGGTYTKYFSLEISASYLAPRVYDSYNPATHSGTNMVGGQSPNSSATLTAGTVKTFYLYVTPRTILVIDTVLASAFSACLEFTKDAAYFQNGITYPCHAVFDGSGPNNGYGNISRMKNLVGGGDSLAGSLMRMTIAGIFSLNAACKNIAVPLRDAVENFYHPVLPLFANAYSISLTGYQTTIGKYFDIFITTNTGGNTGDTVSDGVDTYFVINCAGSHCICFKIQ